MPRGTTILERVPRDRESRLTSGTDLKKLSLLERMKIASLRVGEEIYRHILGSRCALPIWRRGLAGLPAPFSKANSYVGTKSNVFNENEKLLAMFVLDVR